jgi:hypothetical protein
MRCATSRTVLASEPPLRASARCRGVPLGQRRVARVALRLLVLHDARCVGPTSAFSRLRTSTRASPVPDCVNRFRACAIGEIACFTAVRFASVGRTFSLEGHRGGLVVPVAMRACRTSDIPVASPSCVTPLARSATRESRRDRLQLTRVNGASRADDPGCLPSCKDPSPRDALSSARLRTSPGSRFGHRMPGSRRLFTPGCPCEHPRAGLPSTCPVANGNHASSSLGAACRLLQPEYDARAHPIELSTLAREWSFRSATRRHQPMPVALASAMRCRTEGLRATTCTHRLACDAFRLRGRDKSWAEALEQRRFCALLDDVAHALLVAPRAPGSPARSVAEVGGPP